MKMNEAAIKLGLKISRYMDENNISKYQVLRDTNISKLQLNRVLRGDSVETRRTVFPLLEYLKLEVELKKEDQ